MQSVSFNVNKALDGKTVRPPRLLAPLEADGKGRTLAPAFTLRRRRTRSYS